VILDNFSKGRREHLRWAMTHGRIEIVDGDIRDSALVHELMSGVDVVFHQAAIPPAECAEDPRLAVEVLAEGTFNILEAAALNRVKKIVAASSATIYGLAEYFPTQESHHPYNNRSLFGAAKLFTEGLLRNFYDMYGIHYVALRYVHVYGPRMDANGAHTEVLIRWMERLGHREPCLIDGDGKQTMELIYVEDIARANLLAATSNVNDEVLNIGTGVEITISDLATLLGRVMGSTLPLEYRARRRTNPVPRWLADTSRAEQILGFRAQVGLEEGLIRLVSWWERQRALEVAIA
jgi:UDP-glucose 4-epimerase